MIREYSKYKPFRFWCQKVLPLVYDDSLSYYELLNKVVDYLNNVIKDVNALGTAFEELSTMVTDYFENLDVQEEIDNKLDSMVEDGTLDAMIQPLVGDAVSEWLEDNVTPTGSAVLVDTTLTISGAAADAKKTGDEIGDLKSDIDQLAQIVSTGIAFTESGFIRYDGAFIANEDYIATDYINCIANETYVMYRYRLQMFSSTKIAYYDENKVFISAISPTESSALVYVEGTVPYVDGAKYVRFCTAADAENYYVRYATVKNAIVEVSQANVTGLTEKLAQIDEIVSTGIAFTESGFIRFDGILIANSDYIATDYIDCIAGGTFVPYKYRLKMFVNTKIAYYNENKQFISAISPSSSSTLEYVEGTVPYVDKAKYIRFCTASDSVGHYVKYASVKNQCVAGQPANPCDYTGNDMSIFNKILCIGDSLTSGTFNYSVGGNTGNYIEYAKYSYPTYLKKLTGCDTVNMGNGGRSSAEWYNEHQNDNLSGYDCAILQLGVNDCIRYTTWGQTSITAFTNIISKLKAENKNIKIFVANIIPATSYSNAQYLAFSSDLLAWVQSTYASDNNVIPLDIQRYGHTKDSAAYNCGHLSAYGYWRLAQDYKGYIGWYMNQNKNVFKEVQFIGTDYYYDPIT